MKEETIHTTETSIGQRVKYYRKLLNVSQKELASGRVSSNLVSLVEAGKIKLAVTTASILVDNMNQIAEQKGMDLRLSIRDLLMSEEEYAQKFSEERLKILKTKKFDLKMYEELFNFSQKCNIQHIVCEVGKILGEHYSQKSQYHLAVSAFKEALDASLKINNFVDNINISLKLGYLYSYMGDFHTAASLFKETYESNLIYRTLDKETTIEILFQLSYINSKLASYEDAAEDVRLILNSKGLTDEKRRAAMLLQADILFNLEKYEEAIRAYEALIEQGIGNLDNVYNNIAIALNKLNRTEETVEYLKQVIFMQLNSNSPNITVSLFEMALAHKEKGEYKISIIYLENAIRNALKFNQCEEQIECYEILYEILKKTSSIEDFKEYEINALKILENKIYDSKKVVKFTLFMIEYFLETEQIDSARKFISKVKENQINL